MLLLLLQATIIRVTVALVVCYLFIVGLVPVVPPFSPRNNFILIRLNSILPIYDTVIGDRLQNFDLSGKRPGPITSSALPI